MGACALFWRRDGVELATLLHGSNRLLNGDYGLFDCCGLAFTEANLAPLRGGFGPVARVGKLCSVESRHFTH